MSEPRHVLLVDDSSVLLAAASQALKEAGYHVTSASSGADALCQLSSKPQPDAMVLDLVMPDLDGYEVLKQMGPAGPLVVLMSGAPIPPELAVDKRVARVLTKPFNLTELLEAVESVLAHAPAGGSP